MRWQQMLVGSSPGAFLPMLVQNGCTCSGWDKSFLKMHVWHVSTSTTETLWGGHCRRGGHGGAPGALSGRDSMPSSFGASLGSRDTLPKAVPSWQSLHPVTELISLGSSGSSLGPALQSNIFFCPILLPPSSFDRCLFYKRLVFDVPKIWENSTEISHISKPSLPYY